MDSGGQNSGPGSSRHGPRSSRRARTWSSGFPGQACRVLQDYLSEPNCEAVLAAFEAATGKSAEHLAPDQIEALCVSASAALDCFGVDSEEKAECLARLRFLEPQGTSVLDARSPWTRIPVEGESDIVRARLLGREMGRGLGFSVLDQTKIATAISELAHNIVEHAGKGRIELRAVAGDPCSIEIVARDEGPGIADVPRVMSPSYRSRRGFAAGLRGTQRLMDHFRLVSQPGKGTTVTIRKFK